MSKKPTLYVAYGSNMNLPQMALRCPTAEVVATSELKDFELLFRGSRSSAVATVEPKEGSSVPVLLWKIREKDEKYTFRTWLLRLGLNGDEFATARQHLLANLPGCIAWRDPAQAEAQKERLRQKREEEREQILRQSEERQEEVMEPEEAEQAEAEAPAFTMSM